VGRYAHPDDFFRLAEEFHERDMRALLGLDKKTISRWRSSQRRIPWAYFQLLHDHSRYGLAERDAAEGFNRNMLTLQVESLQRRIAELSTELARQSRLVDWRCANDPFINPHDPRSSDGQVLT
jgi:hypothetical protein